MSPTSAHIAFIGGGNMASAIVGGLIRQGMDKDLIDIVDPVPEVQAKLKAQFGVQVHATASSVLSRANLVVWAVKPQHFKEAALQVRFHTRNALHLSVAAGIRSDHIAKWLGNERVIRSMPNTPALIGKGITGLYARPAVSPADRLLAQQVIQTTGDFIWLTAEDQLDAVTALSGSGPAYVFYFLEARTSTGAIMGLPREQAYELAVATFIGAAELARSGQVFARDHLWSAQARQQEAIYLRVAAESARG